MLEAVKSALGIQSNFYNTVLASLIASAKADLQLAGIVQTTDDTDQFLITAVASYAQAYLPGTDADKREAFLKIYQIQKHNMMMSEEYTEAPNDAE